MVFSKQLIRTGQTRTFSVETDPRGWRAVEVDDGRVKREWRSANWRRIEGQIALFEMRAKDLVSHGWEELVP
jgi:hypothetical protein